MTGISDQVVFTIRSLASCIPLF